MLNPFTEINWKPGTAEKRKFAVSLMMGFPIMAVLLLLAGRWHTGGWNPGTPLWVAGVGAGLGAVLWLLPVIATPFYVVWYGFACCMGLVVGNVLLSLFFFVVVSGVGLILRLMGKDPIRKSFDKGASTYWSGVPEAQDSRRYYKQF